jgi:hypothetical protein
MRPLSHNRVHVTRAAGIKGRAEYEMPYTHNPHGCMPDVLNLVSEMTLFYDKYHLLRPDARVTLNKDMDSLHRRLSKACVVLEADIASLSRRLQVMDAHFQSWMQDPAHQNKTWRLHPSDDFKLLKSKSKIVLARMEHEILTNQLIYANRN